MVITTEPSPQALDKGFSFSFLVFVLFVFGGFVVVVKMDLHDSNIGKVQKDQVTPTRGPLLSFILQEAPIDLIRACCSSDST